MMQPWHIMDTEITWQKQIEFYSNGIVAFVVVESLAFMYAFGTSEFFNNLVKTASLLAEIIFVQGLAILVLAILATYMLGRTFANMVDEHSNLVAKLYIGKIVVILLFASMPP